VYSKKINDHKIEDEKIEKAIMSHVEVYHKSRRKIND